MNPSDHPPPGDRHSQGTARASARRSLSTLMLAAVMGLLMPSLAHAWQLSFWAPCYGSRAETEKRTVDISKYMKINTIGMDVRDYEDLYCVTRTKCIAMGYCKAFSPEEQAAADKLKKEMAAEEARLQRERQAKAAQAERDRALARQKAEEERRQKEAAELAEKNRREKMVAADAQRLKLSAAEAKRLVDAREEARKKMPKQPEKCTIDHPAYSQKLDLTPTIVLEAEGRKNYKAIDTAKMCNGRGGKLAPMQCDAPADFFGLKFAACSAMMHCPAHQETKTCARISAQ